MNITTKFSVGEKVTLDRNNVKLGPINAIIIKESGLVYNISGWNYQENELRKSLPPNPYPKGTFAWAWEEIKRGNKVRLNSVVYEKDITSKHCVLVTVADGRKITNRYIAVEDINSTNWKLVE